MFSYLVIGKSDFDLPTGGHDEFVRFDRVIVVLLLALGNLVPFLLLLLLKLLS